MFKWCAKSIDWLLRKWRRFVRAAKKVCGESTVDQSYVLDLAKDTYGWTKAKLLSWYKKENKNLGGASPRELVNRGEGQAVVDFLIRKSLEKRPWD